MEAMVQEIVFWMNLSDEYYVLITDMFVVINQMLAIITDSLDLLNEYGQLVNDYGDALSAVVNENKELREQIADLIQDKQYILQLLTYIWDSLGAFIERMRGQGLILPGEYPALDNGTLETLRDSSTMLNTFLEGVQMPAPPAAAGNTNASMLCMLNTLYFILISQMDPAVEPILLELYGTLQPGEIDLIIKVFFKLVFAIRKNLRRVPNPIENWGDTIDTITLRLQAPIQRLFTHEATVISVFETFIGDPAFFKKDYSDGNQVIKEDKHNSTLMTYMFFLAVVAGTLHTPENQRILNEFGCSVVGPLDDVVPPPPPPASHTLTLETRPRGIGILTGQGPVNDGTYKPISWEPGNSGYSFEKWDPRYSVIDAENKHTRALPITEDKTITAILNEPAPFNPKDHCDEYRKIFFRTDGTPHIGIEYERQQKFFRERFSDEEFEKIKRACQFIPQGSQQQVRSQGPEHLVHPQAILTGTSASAIGSKIPADIPRQTPPQIQSPLPRPSPPSGLRAITRTGGRRHPSGNVTRKRRTH
jgi:hypothetical protein